jgi:hypothetical protein
MKHSFSVNSRLDLERHLENFSKENPKAALDEVQVGRALARAVKMDNDIKDANSRITFEIDYRISN